MPREHNLTPGRDRTLHHLDIVHIDGPGTWQVHLPKGAGAKAILIAIDDAPENGNNDGVGEEPAPRAKSPSHSAACGL